MKRLLMAILVTVLVLVPAPVSARRWADTVTQVSTIDAILAGVYDGQVPLKELLKKGDFGIGTFHGLDGEAVFLDGKAYQIRADGRVYRPAKSEKTPFASVVQFKPEIRFQVEQPTDWDALTDRIDGQATNPNLFCAVKVTGAFSYVRTRSVPGQTKPYPPLVDVTKHQPEFVFEEVRGTIVGFRSPGYTKGIGVPGYHLHFLTEARDGGGHLLAFTLEEGTVELDVCNRLYMILPENNEFGQADFEQDRSEELHEAEK